MWERWRGESFAEMDLTERSIGRRMLATASYLAILFAPLEAALHAAKVKIAE
jgi:hypothetical protein